MATASFDFQSIFNRLYNFLKQKSEHKDMSPYGTNVLLLEDIATEMAYEMLYDEYATRETKWNLARNISSLVTQSYFHGFKIPRKIGAKGVCRVSISKDFDEKPLSNIPIPRFTTFSTEDDIKAVTIEDTIYTTNDDYCDIRVSQGIFRSASFEALGKTFEEIIISNKKIDNDLVFIYVNNLPVTIVDSLYDVGNDKYYCQIDSLPDLSGIKIIFGDGVFGKQLLTNDSIYIQYIETEGKEGNLLSTDLLTIADSNIYNIEGRLVELYVTNIEPLVGGVNEIDIEKLRTISPRFYQSGNRAGTVSDYHTLLNNIPYIKKATVWGSYEINLDQNRDPWEYIPTEENIVHISAVNDMGEDLTTDQKLQLIEDIYLRKPPTDILEYNDLNLIRLKFYITAYIDDRSKTLPYMISFIKETLKDTFQIENFDFKQNVYGSDVYALIDNLPGVRYANIAVRILKKFKFEYPYAASFIADMIPVDYSISKIFLKHQSEDDFSQIAEVLANGRIIGMNDYDTTGSRISLSTGSTLFVVNNLLDRPVDEYDLYFEYNKTNTENILLTSRNQIISYYDSEVSCVYYNGG